ncbi:hypothetical protein VTP01DRAFT_3529 [Rhizomucor pusillus]|uniref:uncharacterized protein n=1 Tax=Rhizomucor pusillus TaxID=4840 RepID=UPI0037427B78
MASEYASYELIQYRFYTRVTSGMTLVPALNNSLYPFRSAFPSVPPFDSIGLVKSTDIAIEWPWDRLPKASNDREASVVGTIRLVDSDRDSSDSHRERQSNDARLLVMKNYLRLSDYRPTTTFSRSDRCIRSSVTAKRLSNEDSTSACLRTLMYA